MDGLAARDGEAEAGVGEAVAGEDFVDGAGKVGVGELERDEERFGAGAGARGAEKGGRRGRRGCDGREDAGGVEQAGVAQGNGGGVVVYEFSVKPGNGHAEMRAQCGSDRPRRGESSRR